MVLNSEERQHILDLQIGGLGPSQQVLKLLFEHFRAFVVQGKQVLDLAGVMVAVSQVGDADSRYGVSIELSVRYHEHLFVALLDAELVSLFPVLWADVLDLAPSQIRNLDN